MEKEFKGDRTWNHRRACRLILSTKGENMLHVNDFVIDKPEEELFAYHRSTMTSPEIFALEQQRIFETCWLYLGHESEVPNPGDFVRRDIAGRPIFFVRSRRTGQINVFYN